MVRRLRLSPVPSIFSPPSSVIPAPSAASAAVCVAEAAFLAPGALPLLEIVADVSASSSSSGLTLLVRPFVTTAERSVVLSTPVRPGRRCPPVDVLRQGVLLLTPRTLIRRLPVPRNLLVRCHLLQFLEPVVPPFLPVVGLVPDLLPLLAVAARLFRRREAVVVHVESAGGRYVRGVLLRFFL